MVTTLEDSSKHFLEPLMKYNIYWCSNSGAVTGRKPSPTEEEEHLTYHSADTLYGTDDANHLFLFLPLPEYQKLSFAIIKFYPFL